MEGFHMDLKTENSSRNTTIDIIKGFACIAVVWIHYSWSNDAGVFLKTISRFAVPFFFFVSGYYLPDRYGQIKPENIRKKIVHIVDITWKSGMFYLFFCVLWNLLFDRDWSMTAYICEKVTKANVIKLILANDPLVYDHLWYLLALLYCYAVMYLFSLKFHNPRNCRVLLPLSLLLMLGFSVLDEFNSVFHIRNAWRLNEAGTVFVLSNAFLFRAMPFFLFGLFVKTHVREDRPKVSLPVLCGGNLCGMLIALYEMANTKSLQFYVGTYISVICLILISVWYPRRQMKGMAFIGNKLSMNVYLYHIAVGKVFDLIAGKKHLWGNQLFRISRPVLIIVCTLVLSYFLYSVKERRANAIRQQA